MTTLKIKGRETLLSYGFFKTELSSSERACLFGLKYMPVKIHPKQEVSDIEFNIIKTIMINNAHKIMNIMEIGVQRNGERSFTQAFIKNKHPYCKYLGVDLVDKSFLNNDLENIYTLQCSSSLDRNKVLEFLHDKNMDSLDILFIDGDHSLDGVVCDFFYSRLVRRGGFILFHDIHTHEAVNIVVEELIDRDLFDVNILTSVEACINGLAVIIKK